MSSLQRALMIAVALFAAAAQGDAVVNLCGKDVVPNDPGMDLSEALAIGGHITFACTGRIKFTRSHGFAADTQVEGANQIILDGEGHRMFGLGSSGTRVSFKGIRIEDAGLGGLSLPGSVIVGEGSVSFLEGTYIERSVKPVWIMAGDLALRGAHVALNQGPSLIVSEGTLSITGSRLEDNSGPLIHTSSISPVRIHDSQFNRNGGSVFGAASPTPLCPVSITQSRFAHNNSPANGGAIHSYCNLTVEESWFEHNRAQGSGGAILLDAGANATMRVVKFISNEATLNGGAFNGQLNERGKVLIRHTRFESNKAGKLGGAVLINEAAHLELTASLFLDNTAGEDGGGLFSARSRTFVSKSLLRRNSAQRSGGAIALCAGTQMSRISNTIIANNSAPKAGAFLGQNLQFLNATLVSNGDAPIAQMYQCAHRSTIEFANTILEGGMSGVCVGADANNQFTDLGHNLQFPGHSCGASIPAAPAMLGPFFAPIRPVSPAGSAGNKALCMAPPIGGRDIYGTHRPQGPGCSIGAVEGDLSTLIAKRLRRQEPLAP